MVKAKLDIEKHRHQLRKDITSFRKAQKTLMPMLNIDSDNNVKSELLRLHLPSAVDLHQTDERLNDLRAAELSLCLPQALDALADLRKALCVSAHLSLYRIQQVRGQAANTRSQGYIARAEIRKLHTRDRYRHARMAYLALKRATESDVLRELQDANVAPLQSNVDAVSGAPRRPREEGLGEGYREVSWIWMQSERAGQLNGELNEGMLSTKYTISCLLTLLSWCFGNSVAH
jgi:hypothetical protein